MLPFDGGGLGNRENDTFMKFMKHVVFVNTTGLLMLYRHGDLN
jgi:hypothetical protein